MENRANGHEKPRYTNNMQSRIQRDLSLSPHHPNSPSPDDRTNKMMRRILPKGGKPHVCVVGAGVAGLRCADVLLRHGVKVTILEARNRIGGRLHQSTCGGHLVDMGANWIHGTVNNPILTLAEETKTVTHKWGEQQAIFNPHGKLLSSEKALEYTSLLWGIISDAFQHSNEHSASIPMEKSLLDFFREKVDEKDLDQEDKDMIIDIAQMWGAYVGSPIEKQSLRFFWLEETIDGENLFVASTYKAILDLIASSARKLAMIRLETEVVKILRNGSNANNKGNVSVMTAKGGEAMSFDELVLTTPLGWLKNNKAAFEPPLPPRISEAIDNLGYGRLEKVYVSFPCAFWDEALPTSASQHNGPMMPPAPIPAPLNPNTTITTSADTSPHFPGFTTFTKLISPASSSHHPSCETVSLAALPPSCAHPTLLFYIFGPLAAAVTTRLTHIPPASPKYARILTDLFHPYYSLLPNYSPENPACTPAAFLATDWTNDRFAGHGSYTNFQIGLEHGDEDVEALREAGGMGEEGGVWLAGEHTAPFVALGTVTGAWWSGEGVARRIVGCYGLDLEK
ncbi:MAG: hypothetical protein M1834_002194 [Cirrosporium novae-zelandiae]|nr:MAG: hypothetical protein M1834_002194 [Cirrosporium novae-zelandiae]